jgi:hypothetical protein
MDNNIEASEEIIQSVIDEAAASGYAIGLAVKRNLDGTGTFEISYDTDHDYISHVESFDIGTEADWSEVLHDVVSRFLAVQLAA